MGMVKRKGMAAARRVIKVEAMMIPSASDKLTGGGKDCDIKLHTHTKERENRVSHAFPHRGGMYYVVSSWDGHAETGMARRFVRVS